MNAHPFSLHGVPLLALPSGALHLPQAGVLCVSDLHLGKSGRIARRGGTMLPPYETRATLDRLAADIAATDPGTVVCLGDSFDDRAAAEDLDEDARLRIAGMQAGRRWIWIEGNHDPGPVALGGTHLAEWRGGPLVFRHIAEPGARAEISGHYHPKLALPGGGGARPCFLQDADRLILPAYGAYTGGMSALAQPLRGLLAARAMAILTGRRAIAAPLPEAAAPPRPPQAAGWPRRRPA